MATVAKAGRGGIMNQIAHNGQHQNPDDGQHLDLVKPRTKMKKDADPFQKPLNPAFLRYLFQKRSLLSFAAFATSYARGNGIPFPLV